MMEVKGELTFACGNCQHVLGAKEDKAEKLAVAVIISFALLMTKQESFLYPMLKHLFRRAKFHWAINRNLNCKQKSTFVSRADGNLFPANSPSLNVSGNSKDRHYPIKKTRTRMRTIILTITLIFSLTNIFGQAEEAKLKISYLTDGFYIYTTYNTYEGSRLPANGMYLLTNNGVVLFDTPWDTTQFQPLLDSIKLKHNKSVNLCIATHWHSDRTEGLEYYKQKGIKTYTTFLTDELSKKNNKKRAEFLMTKDTVFNIGQYSFETYYPGEGHTADNIIVWFSKEKILYGGCLIKGADAEDLGYLGDANVEEYETTLKKVQKKCPDPKYIIISHSDWNNINSLKHSIKLARKMKKKNYR